MQQTYLMGMNKQMDIIFEEIWWELLFRYNRKYIIHYQKGLKLTQRQLRGSR